MIDDDVIPCHVCGSVTGCKCPPFGLMPESLHEENRIVNILEAMLRCVNDPECLVVEDWLTELCVKIKALNKRRQKES